MNIKRLKFDTILYQKDRRIRIPKQIQEMFGLIPGETKLEVYVDPNADEIIIKPAEETQEDKEV